MHHGEWIRLGRTLKWVAIWSAIVAIGIEVLVLTGGGHISMSADTGTTLLDGLVFTFGLAGAIAASIYGTSLALENDGHLEMAWTKPVSRLVYGLGLMGTNVTAIAAVALLITLVHGTLHAMQGQLRELVTGDAQTLPFVVLTIAFILAWFGLVQAISASLRGRAVLVIGYLLWPVAITLAIVQNQTHGLVQRIATALDVVNPLEYAVYALRNGGHDSALMLGNAFALFVLAAIGIAAALYQWRRVEA